jgi:hypothetical protein
MPSLNLSYYFPSSSSRGYSILPTSLSAAEAAGDEDEELYSISSTPIHNKPLPPTPRPISLLRRLLRMVLWILAIMMFFLVGWGVFTFLRAFGRSEGHDGEGDRGVWGVR